MPKTKRFRTGRRTVKTPFWRNFLKKRKRTPQMELAVSTGPKKHKTAPDRWKPPFAIRDAPPLKVDKQDLIVVNGSNAFDLGRVTATVGIMLQVRMDHNFQLFVDECLERLRSLDWGGISEEERRINERRISARTGTVCGVYTDLASGVQIWIASDLDQGITRISLADEH